MQTLDAKTVPLNGTNLIEASAGTGKTWTISWLYLRLIAVQGLKVDQILVVTYTDAATAELRDRIRRRLADALAYLEGFACEEPYETLLADTKAEICIRRLRLALVSFDEAAVFTIHGFCKRVLTENAFEARVHFENELVANEDELLTQLTDQFWYQHFLKPDSLHLMLLKRHGLTPDSLLADVRNFIGKPYLFANIPPVAAEDLEHLNQKLEKRLQACAKSWQQHQDEVKALLLSGVLQGTAYRSDYVGKWSRTLDKLFAGDEEMTAAYEELKRFGSAHLKEKTKAGKAPPVHDFFALVDKLLLAWKEYAETGKIALEHVRFRLLQHLRAGLPKRKQQLGILTFDDLLLHLRDALEQHEYFAARLADKYQAALIDEFQDTDPIQYEIFTRIYRDQEEKRLFFVGDPKQAIYGFRGADIYTYIKAAKAVEHRHTLAHNYRSHGNFLSALNHVFAQSSDPFRSEIAYEAVEVGRPQDDLCIDPPLAPMRLWDWDKLDDDCKINDVQEQIAKAVADDIARLLNAAKAGKAMIGQRALESRDIAVLVRENKQGDWIKQALLERGIASVQKSRDSIFHTREATELRAVLRAIAEPGNEYALKQALVTELFGYNACQLYELEAQPELLEAELEAFHAWHQVWQNQGFMPMFRQWMLQRKRHAHLLALADGERRLTNLLHLAELIHIESRLKAHGMHTVIRWLQHKAETDNDDEAHQLRLESDENLVQIVTIHKSKGLEYGIVYCPYLWREKEIKRSPAWFSWYDPLTATSCLQAQTLALEGEKHSARMAERAESLRLLYVALTRAKYHCTIAMISGSINQFDYYSALGWLLFGSMAQAEEILGKLTKDSMQAEQRQRLMHRRLQEIMQGAKGLISHEPLPANAIPIRYQAQTQTLDKVVRCFKHQLPPVPKVGSFSGLTAGKDDEKPDYDVSVIQAPVMHEVNPLAFPRGTQAGSCLHKMLEELDFTQPLAEQREKVIQSALQRHGLATTWQEAAENLLMQVLTTPLPVGFALQELPKQQRLDELEFYFPVKRLRLRALQDLLHRYLPAEWTDIHAAIEKLKFNTLTGFMKGYIDLVFEHQGQYYVVDYKSNDLGSQPQDYAFMSLQLAMADHHYYLQYLLYCLALHRYLRLRLPNYYWERHAGGVLYLFLRGMEPSVVGSGVFFHKPDAALIEALDQLMNHP